MKPPALYRGYTTQAQIDAQYDTSQSVEDEPRELARYVERSAAARSKLPAVLDVPYGPAAEETLDIFPAETSGAPVFVFLHGGYWRSGSSREFSFVALGLNALGITTVIPNYALCPNVGIDEIVRQSRAAVAWVLRYIGEHRGDCARVAVGGHSAGAHLAAMCLQTRWDEDFGLPIDPLSGAVLASGVYDLEPLRHSYLQADIRLSDGVIERNSPVFTCRPSSTPALVTWGGCESHEFERQSRSMHDAWQQAGNRSELFLQPEAHHFATIHGFEHACSPLCLWLARALEASRP